MSTTAIIVILCVLGAVFIGSLVAWIMFNKKTKRNRKDREQESQDIQQKGE